VAACCWLLVCCCCVQVKCHACVGGTSVREDARILSAGEQEEEITAL
jgi:hypothetical protein